MSARKSRRGDVLRARYTNNTSSSSSPPSKKQMHVCPAAVSPPHEYFSASSRFSVGLAMRQTDLGDRTSLPEAPSSFLVDDDQPRFVRKIMHRAVNHRCFDVHVLLDATPQMLSAAFNVPQEHIEQVWLAGLDSAPLPPSQLSQPQLPPQEQPDRHQPLPGMLDRNRFNDLFTRDQPSHDPDVLEFAQNLIAQLFILVQSTQPDTADSGTQRSPTYSLMRDTVPHSGSASSAGMLDSTSSSPVDERRCGFSEKGNHPDVQVLCGGLAIRKNGNGLYRTARSAKCLLPGKDGPTNVYFEVIIVEDCGAGGICVGVSTDELPLNKLVGSNETSIGLHSSGQIVSRGGEFRDFARGFSKGDRVGCQVSIDCGSHADMSDEEEQRYVVMRFCINGEWQGCLREHLGERFAKGEAEIFAAVSLYKKASKAVIHCCEKDWAMKFEPNFGGRSVDAICAQHP